MLLICALVRGSATNDDLCRSIRPLLRLDFEKDSEPGVLSQSDVAPMLEPRRSGVKSWAVLMLRRSIDDIEAFDVMDRSASV